MRTGGLNEILKAILDNDNKGISSYYKQTTETEITCTHAHLGR